MFSLMERGETNQMKFRTRDYAIWIGVFVVGLIIGIIVGVEMGTDIVIDSLGEAMKGFFENTNMEINFNLNETKIVEEMDKIIGVKE